jgi:cation diffusion facilitator CzcD-associated flavoprotein CzcO
MSGTEQYQEHVNVAIIGTGFAGLGTAIKLRERGEESFVVFEKAHDVGGTWRDNSYPGCACDVPSHLYSFSFEPNPEWSRTFSYQPEIWAYLRKTAAKHDLLPKIRFGHEVVECAWSDADQHWRIETSGGTWTASVLVSGSGGLSEPKLPEIPGSETFEGEMFHSARWNHDHDLTGRKVAVIGTGASAIQFVPRIQPKVGELKLFQRTPPWVMPRTDRPLTDREHRLYRRFPLAQRAMRTGIYFARELFVLPFMRPKLAQHPERIATAHLYSQVKDPDLRRKLKPTYKIGCKRILISNDYYPALAQPNVDVVCDGIQEIRPSGIVARDGTFHEVDTIIAGTGFHVTDMPIVERIRGREGHTLAQEWQGSPRAHLGMSVAGYPNLYFLLGPNTGLGHNSAVFMIEAQINHVMSALDHLRRTGSATIEPTPQAQARFIEEIDERLDGTVWNSGGCASWYLDATGRNSTIWPGFTFNYKQRVERFDPAEFDIRTPVTFSRPVAA